MSSCMPAAARGTARLHTPASATSPAAQLEANWREPLMHAGSQAMSPTPRSAGERSVRTRGLTGQAQAHLKLLEG